MPINTGEQAAVSVAEQAAAGAIPAGQAAAPAATTAAAPAPAETLAKVDSFAEEDAALEAARKQLEAEEAAAAKAGTAAAGTTSTGAAPAAAATGATAAAAPAATSGQAAATAAAKSGSENAIIALRRQNGELKAQILLTTGENRALKAIATTRMNGEAGEAGESTEQQEQLTYEQQFEAIDAERERIAAEMDNGQVSAVEYQKQMHALNKRERELTRQEAEEIAANAQAGSAQPQNDLALANATTTLITDYPILTRLTAAQLDPLKVKAYADADFEGRPIGEGPQATVELRTRMARLAELKYDPEAFKARRQKEIAAAAPAGQQPSTAGATTGAAAPTAAQREAKLALAASMPPEIGSVGAGAPAGDMTVDQIEIATNSMNEDQRIEFWKTHPNALAKIMAPQAGR